MEKYEIQEIIGQGQLLPSSYGTVYKALHRQTGITFAIKKFKQSQENQSVKKIAQRQIRLLRQLKHHNIVTFYQVFRSNKKLCLVFEYVQRTVLSDLEQNPTGLNQSEAKKIIYQLVSAVSFCHEQNVLFTQIIHRDIKPQNMLISKNGILKICDFGFARSLTVSRGKFTDYVSTRWYRAPQLLVGAQYGKQVDIWAIGCLFAELMTGEPLFPGDSDLDTLYQILAILGNSLTEKHKEVFSCNPIYEGLELPEGSSAQLIEEKFAKFAKPALGFLQQCLKCDPEARSSCEDLLKNEYFDSDFKREFQQYMLDAIAKQIQEKRIFYNKKSPGSPEPPKNTSSILKKIQKSLGTIRLNPDDLIPNASISKQEDEKTVGFLPELKVRKEEESLNLNTFYGSRKRREVRIPYINPMKVGIQSNKTNVPSLKIIDFQQNIIEKPNLSVIHENFQDSFKMPLFVGNKRFDSRVHLKSKTPSEFPAFNNAPTPLPPKKATKPSFYKKKPAQQDLFSSKNRVPHYSKNFNW